jgi:imidazolonepropionase-like amidohydrolase
MRTSRTILVGIASAILPLLALAQADLPHVYAITGGRVVTVSGATIPSGTVVVRGGLIEAVGPDIAPPAGAVQIDARGKVIYPGLIDMGQTAGVEAPAVAAPASAGSREEIERWKRGVLLRPQIAAAVHLKADAPALTRLAAIGITSVLATPPDGAIRGQSALVNVVPPEPRSQIGELAESQDGRSVVRTPVALHVSFPDRPRGSGYPQSLLGVIAFVRQAFLDAGHYHLAQQHYARQPRGASRPAHDAALEAMGPVVDRQLPVAFEATSAREIRRALQMASDLSLEPIISGGHEADEAIRAELKAAGAPVLFSLNYPVRPAGLAPDADEPLRVVRFRANVPRVPAALARDGIPFAFQSGGLGDRQDFLKNVARAVAEGLPADAALRALTLEAARIAGAADRLGSIEPGKIANLIVTDGDLFHEKTKIEHVLVDGRPVKVEPESDERPRDRRRAPGR